MSYILRVVELYLHWKYFLFVALVGLSLVVAEHKNVTPCGMTMKITEKEYVTAFQGSFHHEFEVIIDWVELARGSDILSIQILPHKRATIVTNDDTVWIEHGNHLEDKGASQKQCLRVI